MLKKITPSLFGLILICFFLPFTTISCQNTPLITMSGFEVATGVNLDKSSALGSLSGASASISSSEKSQSERKIPGTPIAGLAFAIACAGIAVGFVKIAQQAAVQAGLGVLGVVLLIVLKSQIDGQMVKQGQGMLQVSYGAGYWLALLAFLGASATSGYRFWLEKSSRNTSFNSSN
jgi:hypothetical protein